MIDIAGTEEEHGFEEGVVQGVKQCSSESETCKGNIAVAGSDAAEAYSHTDDSNVFDAVVGKEFLQIVLEYCHHHSVES